MITLRKHTLRDVPALMKLYPDLDEAAAQSLVEEWNAEQYRGNPFLMLAVTEDNELIGYVNLLAKTAQEVHIGLEIYSPYRGKGFGTLALQKALTLAHEMGYHKAIDLVRKENAASLRIHEKLGFAIVGEQQGKNASLQLVLCRML